MQSFFSPPIAKSTFYDLVQRGKIAEVRGVRGYYRLNESLSRLGMPPVERLPQGEGASTALNDRALVDIALSICLPDELPIPSELLMHELTAGETLKVARLLRAYEKGLNDIHDPVGRLKFAEGVRDAAMMFGAEAKNGNSGTASPA